MPIRQMKESSEQLLVIKPQFHNPMNTVIKNPNKTVQNGNGAPSQEPQKSPPSRNRGRRRGRGGRKSDQSDAFMRPSSRPCTGANKPAVAAQPAEAIEVVTAENGCAAGNGENSLSVASVLFPSSSKSLSFTPRPGYGQLGTKCIVKANHFFAELPDKDLNQYDVSLFPESFYIKYIFCSLGRGGGM